MTATTSIPVTVRWYGPEEGGRVSPPGGPQYAATGRFSSQPVEEMFSVVLAIPISPTAIGERQSPAGLRPLFPEKFPGFADRLARGEKFILHEGRKAVAECMAIPGA
jgi:hypothetical protein